MLQEKALFGFQSTWYLILEQHSKYNICFNLKYWYPGYYIWLGIKLYAFIFPYVCILFKLWMKMYGYHNLLDTRIHTEMDSNKPNPDSVNFRLIRNQSEKCNYNQNLVWFNQIQNRFPCVWKPVWLPWQQVCRKTDSKSVWKMTCSNWSLQFL